MVTNRVRNARNEKAARGPKGATGDRGPSGPAGPPGPAGSRMKPAEVLALVEDQFHEIRKQLEINLRRMAQIQVQLDQIHGLVKQLVKVPY